MAEIALKFDSNLSPEKIDIGAFDLLCRQTVQCLSIDEKQLLLIFVSNKFYVIEAICPHKQINLVNGNVNERYIECPWHHARFNIETGFCVGPLVLPALEVWPVFVEEGRVWITLDTKKNHDS